MTARAGDRWRRLLAGLALLALLVLVVLVVTAKRTQPPAAAALPDDVPVGEAPEATAEPEPAPPPSPPAATPVSGQSSYIVSWSTEPTPAPQEPPPPPRPTRAPQPCVEYTWDVSDSPAIAGQMLVEIRIRNRCGRVLQPLEVLFRAEGYRDGQAIYSAQGNLLERIYPDSVRTVMVALPGSTTFFDRIEVAPIDPPVS